MAILPPALSTLTLPFGTTCMRCKVNENALMCGFIVVAFYLHADCDIGKLNLSRSRSETTIPLSVRLSRARRLLRRGVAPATPDMVQLKDIRLLLPTIWSISFEMCWLDLIATAARHGPTGRSIELEIILHTIFKGRAMLNSIASRTRRRRRCEPSAMPSEGNSMEINSAINLSMPYSTPGNGIFECRLHSSLKMFGAVCTTENGTCS